MSVINGKSLSLSERRGEDENWQELTALHMANKWNIPLVYHSITNCVWGPIAFPEGSYTHHYRNSKFSECTYDDVPG